MPTDFLLLSILIASLIKTIRSWLNFLKHGVKFCLRFIIPDDRPPKLQWWVKIHPALIIGHFKTRFHLLENCSEGTHNSKTKRHTPWWRFRISFHNPLEQFNTNPHIMGGKHVGKLFSLAPLSAPLYIPQKGIITLENHDKQWRFYGPGTFDKKMGQKCQNSRF